MIVRVEKRVVKSLRGLSNRRRKQVETLLYETLPAAADIQDLPNVKRLTRGAGRVRIRIGDIRVGALVMADTIYIERVGTRASFYDGYPPR